MSDMGYEFRDDADHDPYAVRDVKYPNVTVQLTGRDGNAYTILGAVQAALRADGVSEEEVKQFNAEATSGDYNHLLRVCMDWVDVQ